MLRKFGRDENGNFTIPFVLSAFPIVLAVSSAVEYGIMTREKSNVQEALDAACFAAGREFINGATTQEIKDYGESFFYTNLRVRNPDDVEFNLDFPESSVGGGQMECSSSYDYKPMRFLRWCSDQNKNWTCPGTTTVAMAGSTEIRLKNTSEIALVVDNSGSMEDIGPGGGGENRLSIIKEQFERLVTEVSDQGGKIKQLDEPVRFSVVPFAASVNVKYDDTIGENTSWIDGQGKSSIHHENFDWSTLNQVFKSGSKWYIRNGSSSNVQLPSGFDWESLKTAYQDGRRWWYADTNYGSVSVSAATDRPLTRFTLYENMTMSSGHYEESCDWVWSRRRGWQWRCNDVWVQDYSGPGVWRGCVETRPYPYNVNGAEAVQSDWKSLYVPMFPPDEKDSSSSSNSYISDLMTDSNSERQKNVVKYFGASVTASPGNKTDYSCTIPTLLPIQETSTAAGRQKVLDKIDELVASGATNIVQGMEWGWNSLVPKQPLLGARSLTERGNDKYIIVLTDGENTYYTPGSLGYNDNNNNKSIYGAYGYTGVKFDGGSRSRLFMDSTTTATNDGFSNSNYGVAMNFHMRKLCDNIKTEIANPDDPSDPFPGVKIMMIALDLSATQQNNMLPDMRYCASPTPEGMELESGETKMIWNITSGDAEEAVDEIIRLLSNLRLAS